MTEAELIQKYRKCQIVKGSLRKGKGAKAKKNVVDCVCRHCKKKQVGVASSDLHLKLCNSCGEKLNK